MSRCCIVACARGSGQKWSWREKGERQSEREEIPTPFPMAIGDVVSAPVSHVSKKRISGFRDFTWPSLMFSLCCVLLGWFFYTFMFLFIKICTNLTSFKKTQNTQPGHTQRSRHSARSLFGRQPRKNSSGMENEAEKGRKPTQVGFLSWIVSLIPNPCSPETSECDFTCMYIFHRWS